MKEILRAFHHLCWLVSVKARGIYIGNLVKSCGPDLKVYGAVKIYYAHHIAIGKNCTLNHGVFLNGRGGLTIGDNVRISPYVILETGYLDTEAESAGLSSHQSKPIVIQDGAWIASGARILAGVTIGKNAVVAAGAVVTKDVPDNAVVKGIPAR